MAPQTFTILEKRPVFSTYLLQHVIREGFSRNLVQFLLKTFPELCIEWDKSGMTLLHHACASKSLHFVQHLCEKTLQLLVNAYPASITSVDKYGMLPFRHACLNPSSSLNFLFIFLKLSPEVIWNIEKTNGK